MFYYIESTQAWKIEHARLENSIFRRATHQIRKMSKLLRFSVNVKFTRSFQGLLWYTEKTSSTNYYRKDTRVRLSEKRLNTFSIPQKGFQLNRSRQRVNFPPLKLLKIDSLKAFFFYLSVNYRVLIAFT